MAIQITITDPRTGDTVSAYCWFDTLVVEARVPGRVILRLHASRDARLAGRRDAADPLTISIPYQAPPVEGVEPEPVDVRPVGMALREHMRAADVDPIKAAVYRYLKTLAQFSAATDVLEQETQ